MANFAVNCPDEVISRGNALIARMAEGTDEKKAETLNRIFAIVEKSMDDVIMQENGIDTKGLNAAWMMKDWRTFSIITQLNLWD